MKKKFLENEHWQMPQLPLRVQHVFDADIIHEVERVGDAELNVSGLFFKGLIFVLFGFLGVLGSFLFVDFFSDFIFFFKVFEELFHVEHRRVFHLHELVEDFLFIFFDWAFSLELVASFFGGQKKSLIVNDFEEVNFFPRAKSRLGLKF